MVNGTKRCGNLNDTTLQHLLITVKVVAFEKVSFSDTQNPKTVC